MNWKFWNRENKAKETSQLEGLQEEMASLHAEVENLQDQMKKMIRLQMKSTKNTEEKIDKLESIVTTQNKQRELLESYEGRQHISMENMIRLLDEFDHVSSGIKESEQTWQALLEQWSGTLVQSLEKIGVYQLEVIGKTFNPEVAEAIQTVEKDTLSIPPDVPYQVVTIINRGYVSESGRLIRKAKVVTIREDGSNE